ncbi:carbohydrate ABC transporter permease [Albidovulum sp.]|uniref:carbohydrate ABC transporter permease n=1 Tax=Albidovulum sp. TaxID=1872424 RepID=UPI0039B92937
MVSARLNHRLRTGGTGAFFWLAALSVTLFFIFPVYWMFASAFKSDEVSSQFPPVFLFSPTTVNFAKLFTELGAGEAMVNSMFIVSLATLLAMIAGTMAAYALARFPLAGKNALALEVLSIRMLPPIVSVIPLFIIARFLGVFDTPWLLIAVYALTGLPFVVWIMRVFIQDIPQSVEEAAMIDGCGRIEAFARVTLPLLLPGLAATMVIVFMFAWNEFLLASLLTSSEAKTLPVIAANAIKPKAIAFGLACAAGVVMSLPVIVLVLMMQRYLVQGLTLGAVKG